MSDDDAGPDLGKWPRLLVVGEAITEEQANEVIIRTSDPDPFTNDREWRRIVQRAYGVEPDPRHGMATFESLDACHNRLGILWLEYLSNARVAAAAIDGTGHGWCDWNGRVGGAFNIGKWPSMREVHDELSRVAEAFPYLRMRAQLRPDAYKGFTLHDGVDPWEPQTGQWVIADGRATLTADTTLLVVEDEGREFDPVAFIASMDRPGRERHVSEQRLRAAIRQVEQSYVPEH